MGRFAFLLHNFSLLSATLSTTLLQYHFTCVYVRARAHAPRVIRNILHYLYIALLKLSNMMTHHLGVPEVKEVGLMDKEYLARRVMAARVLRQRQRTQGGWIDACVEARAHLRALTNYRFGKHARTHARTTA